MRASNQNSLSSSFACPEYSDIKAKIGKAMKTYPFEINTQFSFSVTFSQLFMCDLPNYALTKGNYGATRSNWTYHTAVTISQTCKVLDLTCKFEANGRRDAVIESREDEPQDVLFAEWEWDYLDIFGKGKELEKLKDSCKNSKTADAFLLTYCPKENYVDYLEKITNYWVSSFKKSTAPPVLYLHTVICEEKAGCRIFERLRTVEIYQCEMHVWTDKYF
jgi:hypothetical protein